MVNAVTISSGIPTQYIPLSFILVLTAFKDFYEDYKRKKSDDEENRSKVLIYDENSKIILKINTYFKKLIR